MEGQNVLPNNMISENVQRVFAKSLTILQDRLKIKVKDAVIIMNTELGDIHIIQGNPNEALLMAGRFSYKGMQELVFKRLGQTLITCDRCLGSGMETLEAGNMANNPVMITCGKCNGGGQMVAVFAMETESAFKIETDEMENNNGQ